MKGYSTNIEQKTLQNEFFREVLFTAPHSQVVVMTLKPQEDIGKEIHETVDQFIRIEAGEGRAEIDGETIPVSNGIALVIPAGTEHNVINTSTQNPLKLYTIYSPAHHKDKTIHRTKEEALADESDHL